MYVRMYIPYVHTYIRTYVHIICTYVYLYVYVCQRNASAKNNTRYVQYTYIQYTICTTSTYIVCTKLQTTTQFFLCGTVNYRKYRYWLLVLKQRIHILLIWSDMNIMPIRSHTEHTHTHTQNICTCTPHTHVYVYLLTFQVH